MSDEYKETDILFSVAVAHILGLSDRHKITILVPSELTCVGSGRQNKRSLKYV